jgi:5-methylcytosine-specific restriction endonuclease McrA
VGFLSLWKDQRMSKKKKGTSLRRRLFASGPKTCYYCGLPFKLFILPKGSIGAAKSRHFAAVTLEHLVARSLGGETTKENCVLAHNWCNARMANLPLPEKLKLKEIPSNNNGLPPWWSVLQKIIEKQNI